VGEGADNRVDRGPSTIDVDVVHDLLPQIRQAIRKPGRVVTVRVLYPQ
jgi:hypothetical protein